MVLRSAVGALATVAIIAAVAAALPEKGSTTPGAPRQQPSFGGLAKPSSVPEQTASAPTGAAPADLLKLASFKRTADPVPQPVPTPTVRVVSLAQPSVSAPVAPAGPSNGVAVVQNPSPQPAPAPPKVEVATAIPTPVPAAPAAIVPQPAPPPPASADPSKPQAGTLVDINKASVDLLDRLPGAGRIGRAIANRRPYGSVEDLVRKRVLRESAFQRIRPYIAVN